MFKLASAAIKVFVLQSVLKLCIVTPFLSGCSCGRARQVLFSLGPLSQLSTVLYERTLMIVPGWLFFSQLNITFHRLVYAFTKSLYSFFTKSLLTGANKTNQMWKS